ncbi:DUF5703 family protein [Gordonia rhizosphera]|uniref:Dihydroorotate dehydrogenase n=1 Tax=Gordonia rhizosphera NBRC 16068 TaxID=1108045 RepID=K6VTP3_9ACTN|nr:DUF5703 family protein [Gordonia rhizosphera]GAB90275.1 hypothetical protein GORHZ_092_00240 [Gordonia rhizosphera NBRC 16068]
MSHSARRGSRYPRGWEVSSETHECLLLNLPPDVTRVSASMRLSIEAEFGGWELKRVRLYTDGTRKVLLRRRKPPRKQILDHSPYPDTGAAAC